MDYIEKLRSRLGNMPLLLAGTAVIVLDEKQQLLLQLREDTGSWGLPGGYMEPGERPEESARRELEEETGLSAPQLELLGVFCGPELYIQYPNGDQVFSLIMAYTARNCSGRLRSGPESKELAFFPLDQTPPDIVAPHRYILARVREFLGPGRPKVRPRQRPDL